MRVRHPDYTVIYLLVPVVADILHPVEVLRTLDLVHYHLGHNVSGVDINGDESTDDAADQLGELASYEFCQFVQVLLEKEKDPEKPAVDSSRATTYNQYARFYNRFFLLHKCMASFDVYKLILAMLQHSC